MKSATKKQSMRKRKRSMGSMKKRSSATKKRKGNHSSHFKDSRSHEDTVDTEFHTVLKSIGDGVIVVQKDMRIVLFNETATIITGYTEEEVEGKSINDVIKIQTEGRQTSTLNIEPVVSKKKKVRTADHVFLIRKDRSSLPVTFSAAPIIDRKDILKGVVITIRDVSREFEVNKMKSEFVSIVSHQLRTPLSAIKWFLETLIENRHSDPMSERQHDYLEQAFQSNERMILLINDLLNVSRLEAGKVKNEPVTLDITSVFKSVVTEIGTFAHANNVTIDCTFCDQPLPEVTVDPAKIRQVIQNLLSNGIKYARGKETLTVDAEVKKDEILFKIHDQGIGIPESDQARLFEPFFRAENAIATQAEGSGLGLYICKILLEFNHGKIWVESEVGKGSTFYFTLPIAKKTSQKKIRKTKVKIAMTS